MDQTTANQNSKMSLEQIHQKDRRLCLFGYRIKTKQDLNDRLSRALQDHVKESYQIDLPATRQSYDCMKAILFRYDELGESEVNPLENKLDAAIKMSYAIRENKAFYANFENEKGENKFRPLCFWYSRNRLDHVWNFRKSQIIRGRYFAYLSEAKDPQGRKLTDYYQPVHLVLTLPHKDGIYNGKRFYARDLINAFRDMRKEPFWKQMIYAGEYGIEVKKSKVHGLHIHLHCFILQNPEFTVNEVRERIETEWRLQTGNETSYSGIHYETLYITQKGPDGKYLKDYIKPGDPLDKYMAGVMECIKYHFKPGCLEREETLVLKNGRKVIEKQFDIELIIEILNNTKNLRLYSRFGDFYKQKSLNFNNLDKEPEDQAEDEITEELIGDSEKAEANLFNPFTWEPAKPNEYLLLFGQANGMVHYSKDSKVPFEPSGPRERMEIIEPGLTIKEAMRLIATNKLGYYHHVEWENYYGPDYDPLALLEL